MSDLDKEVAALLEQAMKQPGVAEVMEAYKSQRAAVDAFTEIENSVAPRWIMSSSSTTSISS
jgi:hypothetical protein